MTHEPADQECMTRRDIPVFEYGGKWCFRSAFMEHGKRRQVRRMFDTKAEALKGYTDFLAARELGDVSTEKLTLGQWCEKWLDILKDEGKSDVTISGRRNILSWYIVPEIGHIKLRKLTEDDVRFAYRKMAAAGLATSTIKATHRSLSACLNKALMEHKLDRNPVRWVSPPKGGAARPYVILTSEELSKLMAVVLEDRLAALWMLVMKTGMRRGELAGLCWSQVDFAEGVLTINRQRTVTPEGVVVDRPAAKTEAGNRCIPIPAGMADLLRAHRAQQGAERLRLGTRWRGGDHVFTSQDGDAYHPKYLSNRLRSLAARAGVRELPLHHLRHTFATHALKARVDPKVVSSLLGHSKVEITRNLYQHVDHEMASEALDTISRTMFG